MKKAISNPKEYDIVEVEWVDSASPSDGGWFHLDSDDMACDTYSIHCFTTGYCIKETKDEIWIINSYHPNLSNINCLGMISIPKVALVRKEVLKRGKSKRC